MLQNVRYPFWGGEGDWATGLQLARQLEAEILIQEGDCTAALPILESLNTHSFYRVSSWYLRAQCHYELKEDEKALELYEQVISYWQDADAPLQPVVQDSRRQRDAILDAMTREPAN